MENTFRDINIALANEFALISEDLGIDVWEAIKLANLHPRVDILKPGPGVGGHCIAIDPWFLTETTLKTQLIRTARGINDNMPNHTFQIMRKLLGTEAVFPTSTILGVAYKENIDDTRETPAEKFIILAKNQGMKIKVYDPHCQDFKMNGISNEKTLEEAVANSDCIVLITGHDVFKKIDPKKIASKMNKKNLLDARNALDHKKWIEAGFKVKVLGNNKK
jgi:UDP-N-acetyl-D-mannosaminuronic acid dehydrogenase